MSQLSRHSTASEGMPPHSKKTVESKPCAQSLPLFLELRERSSCNTNRQSGQPTKRRHRAVASVGEVGWVTVQGLRLPGGHNQVFGFVGGCQGGFRVAWRLRPRVWSLAGGYDLRFRV